MQQGSVPISVAAKVMGKSEHYVRHAIADGRLKIGCYIGEGKRKSYYISPKLFEDLTGYRWKGEQSI